MDDPGCLADPPLPHPHPPGRRCRQGQQRQRHRVVEHPRRLAAGDRQGLAQRQLEARAQKKRDDEHHHRIAGGGHQHADAGEDQHHPDPDQVAGRQVHPDGAQQQRGREHDRLRCRHHPHPQPEAELADPEIREIRHQHGAEQPVDQPALALEQQRPGLDALDHQGADHQGGTDAAGDAEAEQRDQVGADHRGIGAFGRGDAMQIALAEALRLARRLPGRGVAHERRRRRADARHRAQHGADDGAAQHRVPAAPVDRKSVV